MSISQQGSCDLSKLDETEIAELGIGRKFQKPTVFDMHTIEDNLLLALKNDRRVRATLMWQPSAPQIGASTSCSTSSDSRACVRAWPAVCRTGRSSGWKSACCWHRSRSCSWSTNRSPA